MILFEYSDDYARKFGDIAEIKFSKRFFPDQCIGGWEGLVEQIEKGYNWEPEELDFDLDGIRGVAEYFLDHELLVNFSEHQKFGEIILKLDKKFLSLTLLNPRLESFDDFPWWQKRLLKNGGERYTEFLLEKEIAAINFKK